MDFYETLAFDPAVWVLDLVKLAATVLLMMFMHTYAASKNKKLSAWWYVGGFFFPVITFFVFLSERKYFPGVETKTCPACGNHYPADHDMCANCLEPLPEIDIEEFKSKEKKAKKLCISYVAVQAVTVIVTIAAIIILLIPSFEDSSYDSSGRIGISDADGEVVYYDKFGKAYDDPYDVLIYDKDGNVYDYRSVGTEYSCAVYVDEAGSEYTVYDCYVDADGNIFIDLNYELENISDSSFENVDFGLSEDEVYEQIMDELDSYRYYDEVYTDDEGNFYYHAEDASWNEKGELITADNDPTSEPLQ